jgi:hypothetical protein
MGDCEWEATEKNKQMIKVASKHGVKAKINN